MKNCIINVAVFAVVLLQPGFCIYMEITSALSFPRVDDLVVLSSILSWLWQPGSGLTPHYYPRLTVKMADKWNGKAWGRVSVEVSSDHHHFCPQIFLRGLQISSYPSPSWCWRSLRLPGVLWEPWEHASVSCLCFYPTAAEGVVAGVEVSMGVIFIGKNVGGVRLTLSEPNMLMPQQIN